MFNEYVLKIKVNGHIKEESTTLKKIHVFRYTESQEAADKSDQQIFVCCLEEATQVSYQKIREQYTWVTHIRTEIFKRPVVEPWEQIQNPLYKTRFTL